MRRTIIIVMAMLFSVALSAQNIEGFVTKHMQTYPKSRLLDIYKSCFQDYMGAEHLVSDKQRVKAYLDDELNTTSIDNLMPWNYEPCGIDSNYYRISIRTIKESVRKELGVICIFPNQVKADETKIRIVEIYRNKEAYQHHLTTPHFQAYKQGYAPHGEITQPTRHPAARS